MTSGIATIRSELEQRIRHRQIELPMIPATASAVIAMCSDPNCVSSELAELIRRDPSLAAQILRRVNSALDAPVVPIASLQMAVSRLGMSHLRRLAITAACRERIFEAEGFESRVGRLFRHSLATAGFAQEIARVRRKNVEEAFFAGLLHDAGMAVMYQSISDICRAASLPIDPDEFDELVEELHGEVGEVLMQTWDLAENLALVARFHHRPEDACDAEDLARTVRLAEDLADCINNDSIMRDIGDNHEDLSVLCLYEDELSEIYDSVDEINNLLESAS